MSKPILIFGCGQIAQVFAAYLQGNGDEIAAFIVDPKYLFEKSLLGIPVISSEVVRQQFSPEDHLFVVGMSFKGVNAPRAEKYEWMKSLGYQPRTFIDPRAKCIGTFDIGPGSFIMDGNCIQHNVSIGENTILWSGNHIGHHTTIGKHVFLASHAVISGAVTIGDRCFVGVNATIRDNVNIGEGCVIGAGALVLKDCEPDGIYSVKGTERRSMPASSLQNI